MGRVKRLSGVLSVSLVAALGLLLGLLVLLAEPEPIKVIEMTRGPVPTSVTHTHSFEMQATTKTTAQISTDLLVGQVGVEVLDDGDRVQHSCQLDGRDYRLVTLELSGGSVPNSSWRLRIIERGAVGRYKIVVAHHRSIADVLGFLGAAVPSSQEVAREHR
jgi:hypothetical protein